MAKLLQLTNPWKICFTEIYFRNSFLQAFLVVILFPKLGQSQFSTNSRYFCLTFSLKFFVLTLIEISYYSRQISHIHVTLKQCIWLGNFAGVLRTKLQWKYFVLSVYTIPKFFFMGLFVAGLRMTSLRISWDCISNCLWKILHRI